MYYYKLYYLETVLKNAPLSNFGNIYITCHLADAFIQSDLQLIDYAGHILGAMWVKGLAQGPNSCADIIVATPGIESPTLRVQVK